MPQYPTIEACIGNTPLVRLQRLPGATSNLVLAKLEGTNPAGSVKDRPALSMIAQAEARGEISPGDTLIEATSGNTGIALAMAAAIRGYRLILIMPSHMSDERKQAMSAYGAELLEVTREQGMEGARDLAMAMQARGEGRVLDQFGNPDNPRAHLVGTGPEIWQQTGGTVTHFVSSMGTTGTIMGTSRYLKEMNPAVQIVGVQPAEGASIPGIRRWPAESGAAINASHPAGENVPGPSRAFLNVPGNSIGATHAVLRIDDQDLDRKPITEDAAEVSFVAQLEKGSHRLAPVFQIAKGELGAYYVVVTCLD